MFNINCLHGKEDKPHPSIFIFRVQLLNIAFIQCLYHQQMRELALI